MEVIALNRQGLSLKNTILGILASVSLIIAIILSYYSYNLIRKNGENLSAVINQSLSITAMNIESDFIQIEAYMDDISLDKDAFIMLKESASDYDIIKAIEKYTKKAITLNSRNRISGILIFTNNNRIYKIGNQVNYMNMDNIEFLFINEQIYKKKGNMAAYPASDQYYERGTDEYLMPIVRNINDIVTGKHLGYIVFMMSESFFNDYFNMNEINISSEPFISNKYGKIIYAGDKSLIGKNINPTDKEININSELFTLKNYPISKYGLNVGVLIKGRIEYYNTKLILLTSGSIFIVFLLLNMIFSKILIKDIIFPLNNLLSRMQEIVLRYDIQVKFNNKQVYKNNEIKKINAYVDNLVDEIGDLIEKILIKEQAKKESEIKSLQNQINPHFIYNVLNSIKLLTTNNNNNDVEKMMKSLGKILRNFFSETREKVEIREELAIIDEYMKIFKVIYGDQINVEFEIDEWVKYQLIPKFTLQPIIENAIYHGLIPKPGKGSITIKECKNNDNIILSILDNGVGIEQKKVDKLNSLLSSGRDYEGFGIGLFNVNYRLRLIYGNEYGITIESKKGEYTCVNLMLKDEKRDENENLNS